MLLPLTTCVQKLATQNGANSNSSIDARVSEQLQLHRLPSAPWYCSAASGGRE